MFISLRMSAELIESEGEFYFGRNDGWDTNQDGFDTIEWAAQQPWCDGNVGMVGGVVLG